MRPQSHGRDPATRRRVDGRRDPPIRLRHKVAAFDPVTDLDDRDGWLAGVLSNGQHDFGRKREATNRDPGGQRLVLGRMDTVAKR